MSNPIASNGSTSPTDPQVEPHLATSEADVAELRRKLLAMPGAGWLREVIGSQKDEPAFDEVIALGRAHRKEDFPADDDQS